MTRSIPCPYCPRLFTDRAALEQHINSKRRISAAHGLHEDGTPRRRPEIEAAMQRATQEARP